MTSKLSYNKEPAKHSSMKMHKAFKTDMPFGMFDNLKQPSRQIFKKQDNGLLSAVGYRIESEPSRLRPIRSWTLLVDNWTFGKDHFDTRSNDILFMRVANRYIHDMVNYVDIVQDIEVTGNKVTVNNTTAFNTIMALGLMITKIDNDQIPDIDKILKTFNLQ